MADWQLGNTEAMNNTTTTNVAQQESMMREIEPRTNHESCPLCTMDLKSLSPCSLSSHDTMHTPVEPIGDVMGMNTLPQELIEEIVSRTSPLDACGNLSLVGELLSIVGLYGRISRGTSRRFCLAAKSEHVWERFLPADIISRRAAASDSDTLDAFPTKKDLYLFLSDNPLIIDDDAMHFWLEKPSGKNCYHILPETLSIPEPDGWTHRYCYESAPLPFEIRGKICTSLLSPSTAYTVSLWFDFMDESYFSGFGKKRPLETCVWIDGGCEIENRIVYIPYMPYTISSTFEKYVQGRGQLPSAPPYPIYPKYRDDASYEVELGDYFHKECSGDRELHMMLREEKSGIEKGGIALCGIVIRPKRCQKTRKLKPFTICMYV